MFFFLKYTNKELTLLIYMEISKFRCMINLNFLCCIILTIIHFFLKKNTIYIYFNWPKNNFSLKYHLLERKDSRPGLFGILFDDIYLCFISRLQNCDADLVAKSALATAIVLLYPFPCGGVRLKIYVCSKKVWSIIFRASFHGHNNKSQVIDFSTEMKQTDFQTHGLPHQSKLLGELVSFFYQKKKKEVGIVLWWKL